MSDHKIDPSINRLQMPPAGRAAAKAAATAVGKGQASAAPATATDTVRLTSASQRLVELESAVKNTPDVRSDRVERLKQAIADGHYHPSAERIADRLLAQEIGLMRGR